MCINISSWYLAASPRTGLTGMGPWNWVLGLISFMPAQKQGFYAALNLNLWGNGHSTVYVVWVGLLLSQLKQAGPILVSRCLVDQIHLKLHCWYLSEEGLTSKERTIMWGGNKSTLSDHKRPEGYNTYYSCHYRDSLLNCFDDCIFLKSPLEATTSENVLGIKTNNSNNINSNSYIFESFTIY